MVCAGRAEASGGSGHHGRGGQARAPRARVASALRTRKSCSRGGPPDKLCGGNKTAKRGRNGRRLKRRRGKKPVCLNQSWPRGGGGLLPSMSTSSVAGTASTAASLPAHSQMVCMDGVRPLLRRDLRLCVRLGARRLMPTGCNVAMPMVVGPGQARRHDKVVDSLLRRLQRDPCSLG